MIVPVVLMALLLVVLMSGALQTMAWRALRGARTQWDAQRALYAADASIATALANWNAESAARTPIGVPVVSGGSVVGGFTTQLTVIRTSALSAALQATAERVNTLQLLDNGRVKRTVLRYIRMQPPEVPVFAAATILGAITTNATRIDGRDQLQPWRADGDDCGPLRDTASIAALAALSALNVDTTTMRGAATVIPLAQPADARAAFTQAWPLIVRRAIPQSLSAGGEIPPGASWRAVVIAGAPRVTLRGSSQHVGVVAVDGDLVVQGRLRVDGVLIVRGAIDVTAGQLELTGALVVGDSDGRGSALNSDTAIRYAPCLAGRALATVSSPQLAPFLTWNAP